LNNKNLILPVNKFFFNKIKNKELLEDFRAIKPYWIKRLISEDFLHYEPIDLVRTYYEGVNVFKKYETITFRLGYYDGSPSMTFPYFQTRFTSPNEETCIGTGIAFAIKIDSF